jgi:hypothetical protein
MGGPGARGRYNTMAVMCICWRELKWLKIFKIAPLRVRTNDF